ncbi:KEOPS complex subunit Pcc1 [Pyrococcus kukulkanii]|uniref:KEOPS complex subunit n=1 Tax=Pyrococcus kukulkanii TaxID=1609559 RepID=A0A127BA42_9EURY|nr:KEOPS complex subunit Pcc1 [Pyrococcus kukulkanii]AMM54201.1 KEOPS complex subunit [Pyrococcus kukulkanii]
MKIRAEVEMVWEYEDEEVAKAIANAVNVDNISIPEGLKKSLNLVTFPEGAKVITKVKYEGEIETLIVALDDLIFAIKVAEEVL